MPVDRKRAIELIVGVLFVLVRMLCLFFSFADVTTKNSEQF